MADPAASQTVSARLPASAQVGNHGIPAEVDDGGRLSAAVAEKAIRLLDRDGFVVLVDLLSSEEASSGLGLVRDALADPDRESATFASSTDTANRRRDFCPLPANAPVLNWVRMLTRRIAPVLSEYTGMSRSLLEISALVSYRGSSHQYLHRDPPGVLCAFVALDDVAPGQGGTAFVPGTHPYPGSERNHQGRAQVLMQTFQTLANLRIFAYNLKRVWQMRSEPPHIGWREFWQRTWSTKSDRHQPNVLRFLLARNYLMDWRVLSPASLWRMLRHGSRARAIMHVVQVAARRGSVVLYRSDILHAGPDNRSDLPRYILAVSYARDVMAEAEQAIGYSAHSTLKANPRNISDLLA